MKSEVEEKLLCRNKILLIVTLLMVHVMEDGQEPLCVSKMII